MGIMLVGRYAGDQHTLLELQSALRQTTGLHDLILNERGIIKKGFRSEIEAITVKDGEIKVLIFMMPTRYLDLAFFHEIRKKGLIDIRKGDYSLDYEHIPVWAKMPWKKARWNLGCRFFPLYQLLSIFVGAFISRKNSHVRSNPEATQ